MGNGDAVRGDRAGEAGFAMFIVVMSMMLLLTLGAALAATGHQTTVGVSDDELGVRALQAAEAGAQAAVHRMNLQQPADDRCITTGVARTPLDTASATGPATYAVHRRVTTRLCMCGTSGACTAKSELGAMRKSVNPRLAATASTWFRTWSPLRR